MPLTLEQTLLLAATLAFVAAVVFLVRLFIQLRRTAAEGERALAEFRELARNLNELDLTAKKRLEELGQTLAASKKAAVGLAEASTLVTTRVMMPAAKYLPIILPVARFVWRQFRKKKERSHGK
jgi:uncharacterized membrane protein